MASGLFHSRLIDTPNQIEIEQVLPGLPAERARLDLQQVDITQRECAKRSEQRSGDVAGCEHERRFPDSTVASGPLFAGVTKLEETREIAWIIFDVPLQDASTVRLSG